MRSRKSSESKSDVEKSSDSNKRVIFHASKKARQEDDSSGDDSDLELEKCHKKVLSKTSKKASK